MDISLDITSRPRRLRRSAALRELVRETRFDPAGLIYPLFIIPGEKVRREIGSMPEVFQLSVDEAVRECCELLDLGVRGVILFGIPEAKDSIGSGAYDEHGIVQRAVAAIKRETPEMLVVTDVCLCEYTDHGHCGLLDGEKILNDPTVDLLVRSALSHAAAGADIIAPSDMMDGRVGAIRRGLDAGGFEDIAIMSYAVKYSSSFYGPFRDAAESAPAFGDRRSHQMDPANAREAYAEIATDLEEGADAVIVKPATPYLDIIAGARQRFDVPIFGYNVSGEYSMVRAAGQLGWIDERRVTMEILTSIKRAGANQIITYHAKRAARWLREEY